MLDFIYNILEARCFNLERIENIRLLKIAESRANDNTTEFEDFIEEQGFTMNELAELAESVEFE